MIVSSGAIARGVRIMGLRARPGAVEELQAASAVGQGKLYRAYDELLRERELVSAQVLAHVHGHERAHPLPERASDACASCSSGGSCR